MAVWWVLLNGSLVDLPINGVTGIDASGFERAERLHEVMPNRRLATLEGYGHAVHLVAPDRYTDEVLAFISDVD